MRDPCLELQQVAHYLRIFLGHAARRVAGEGLEELVGLHYVGNLGRREA
jgi:hypothetical protein